MFVPHNLCRSNPYQPALGQLRPIVSHWQPASAAKSWDVFLDNGLFLTWRRDSTTRTTSTSTAPPPSWTASLRHKVVCPGAITSSWLPRFKNLAHISVGVLAFASAAVGLAQADRDSFLRSVFDAGVRYTRVVEFPALIGADSTWLATRTTRSPTQTRTCGGATSGSMTHRPRSTHPKLCFLGSRSVWVRRTSFRMAAPA